MKKYEFKTKPFDHQLTTLQESWDKEYYALFMEMGTGKSKVVVDNIGVLFEQGEIDAALIVAPKGVYDNWVQGEIPVHFPDHINKRVLRWEPKTTKSYLAELEEHIMEPFDGIKFFVMNVEAFSTPRGAQTAGRFLV